MIKVEVEVPELILHEPISVHGYIQVCRQLARVIDIGSYGSYKVINCKSLDEYFIEMSSVLYTFTDEEIKYIKENF